MYMMLGAKCELFRAICASSNDPVMIQHWDPQGMPLVAIKVLDANNSMGTASEVPAPTTPNSSGNTLTLLEQSERRVYLGYMCMKDCIS